MKINDKRPAREFLQFQVLNCGTTFLTVGEVLFMKTGNNAAIRLEDGYTHHFTPTEKCERVVCEITMTA